MEFVKSLLDTTNQMILKPDSDIQDRNLNSSKRSKMKTQSAQSTQGDEISMISLLGLMHLTHVHLVLKYTVLGRRSFASHQRLN